MLAWLATKNVDKLPRFVRNGAEEIRKGSLSFQCVSTEQNSADIATRGMSSEDIVHSTAWCNRSPWHRQEKSRWPLREVLNERTEAEEAIVVVTSAVKDHESEPLFETNRTKEWLKMVRCACSMLIFLDAIIRKTARHLATVT